jgi:small subunit ribosomal protein S17
MAEETTATEERNDRKSREGLVTSNGMDKTAVVTVTTRKPHPKYRKTVAKSTKLYVHDEENTLNVGDRVRIAETRPLSKLKRWRIVEILERAK